MVLLMIGPLGQRVLDVSRTPADSDRGCLDSSIRIAQPPTFQRKTSTPSPVLVSLLPQQCLAPNSGAGQSFAAKSDCSSTTDMWCVCRLLCPRPPVQSELNVPDASVDSGSWTRQPAENVRQPAATMELATQETGQRDDSMLIWDLTASSEDVNENAREDDKKYYTNVDSTDASGKKASGTRSTGGAVEYQHEGLKEQLAMVEAMVHEMKVGFMAALEQLSCMQDGATCGTGATTSWEELNTTSKQHQLVELAKSVDNLREDVTTLTGNVAQMTIIHHNLQRQINSIQVWQQTLIEELVSNGVLAEHARTTLSAVLDPEKQFGPKSNTVVQLPFDTSSIKNTETSEHTDLQDLAWCQGDHSRVTAAACKSLSLTQALAAHCQEIDANDSSEEDIDITVPRHNQSRQDDKKRRYLRHNWKASGKSVFYSNPTESAQRRQSVQEIVDAEQEYCMQLWNLINVYQLPLQDGRYMSSRHLCLLFPAPLGDLHTHHCHLLYSLKDRLQQWSFAGVVGDIFAKMVDSANNLLGLYQEYVESLPGSISCLRRQLMVSRSFRAFVKTQKESNANADLTTLLILPLQRIPKYMLQLQQVLRYTKEDHPDFYHLQFAVNKLQEFVERFSQEIAHTTCAISQDVQHLHASGSSCDVPGSQDSNVLHTPQAIFPQLQQASDTGLYLPTWLEQNALYHHKDTSRAQAGPVGEEPSLHSHLAAHSQPDLTYFSTMASASPFISKETVPQVHGLSTLPPSGDRSARLRRFKIKQCVEGRDGYFPPFQNQESLKHRPTSAIDFASQRVLQQRQEGEPTNVRPHSVLGQLNRSGGSKVMHVYSRVNLKPGNCDHQTSDSGMSSSSSTARRQLAQAFPQLIIGDKRLRNPVIDGKDFLLDYENNEEDDTRTADACSSGASLSNKSGSCHSQDVHDETDHSEDYSQEELVASLSRHLGGAGSDGILPVGGKARHNTLSTPVRFQQHLTPKYERKDFADKQERDLGRNMKHTLTGYHGVQTNVEIKQPVQYQSNKNGYHDGDGHSSHKEKSSVQMKESKKVPEHQPNLRPIEVNANNSCEKSALHLLDENQNRATQATLRTGKSHHQDQEQENTSAALLQPEVLLQSSSNDVRQELCVQECDTSLQESGTSPVLSRHVAANDFVNSSDVKMSQDLKAKEKTRRLNKNAMNVSAENLHRSVEDVSSSSKKKAFRTSLKNLFHRKKGSIILDELEREYTRQLVRQTLAPHADDKTTMVGADLDVPSTSIHQATDDNCGCSPTTTRKIDTMNNNVPQCHNNDGFFAKIRRSPLFFMYRHTDTHISDQV